MVYPENTPNLFPYVTCMSRMSTKKVFLTRHVKFIINIKTIGLSIVIWHGSYVIKRERVCLYVYIFVQCVRVGTSSCSYHKRWEHLMLEI